MGVAFFIVAEQEVEGLDLFVNGKALARFEDLDRLAIAAGVRPLMEFFSQSPEEVEEFLDESDFAQAMLDMPPLEWFDAEEGLASVRGIIAALLKSSVNEPDLEENVRGGVSKVWIPTASEVVEDLREFEAVLGRLAAEKVRWHLAVDF